MERIGDPALRESFFARVDHQGAGRLYVGVAAPGRAMKAILLRTYVALLCAALSGASFSLQTYGQERADIGHFFGAIDVASFRPLADVKRDAQAILDQLRNSPKADGHDRIYAHGEKGFAAERGRRADGIPLGPKVVENLKKVGGELGVPWVL